MNIYVPRPEYLQQIYDSLESHENVIRAYAKSINKIHDELLDVCEKYHQKIDAIKEIICKIQDSSDAS